MFWLELDEVQQVFDCGWSCKLYDPEMWTTQRRAAAFPDQGGGCLNQTTWVANPQFFLDLPHKTPVQLTLTQNGTHAIGLCVVRQDRGDDGAAVEKVVDVKQDRVVGLTERLGRVPPWTCTSTSPRRRRRVAIIPTVAVSEVAGAAARGRVDARADAAHAPGRGGDPGAGRERRGGLSRARARDFRARTRGPVRVPRPAATRKPCPAALRDRRRPCRGAPSGCSCAATRSSAATRRTRGGEKGAAGAARRRGRPVQRSRSERRGAPSRATTPPRASSRGSRARRRVVLPDPDPVERAEDARGAVARVDDEARGAFTQRRVDAPQLAAAERGLEAAVGVLLHDEAAGDVRGAVVLDVAGQALHVRVGRFAAGRRRRRHLGPPVVVVVAMGLNPALLLRTDIEPLCYLTLVVRVLSTRAGCDGSQLSPAQTTHVFGL